MTEDTKDHFWVGKFSRIPRNMDFNKIPELKEKAEDFLINPKIFFRHAGIFGSTGSGKTVLGKIICEEAARHGIPIIAIDPQGDIAALKLIGDKQKVMAQGVPGDVFDNYKNTINVKIFTPSSQKGLPISINPINIPDKGDEIEQEDVIKLLDNQAKILVTILIKIANLSARYKSSVEAAIYKVLDGYYRKGEKIETLIELANIIEENTDPDIGIDVFLDEKLRKKLSTVLKTLTVGSTKLLFSGEDNIDIGKLLTPEKDGKTKVNIFFLKSLYSQEEKEFFISVLANELYSWMLRQGQAKKPRCIFFCDEIAPFIPAGSAKPGPKEPLILLFRQARKYGIQCFIATQSPKDVDYHAYEQFNTFFIGRVTSQQSLKVIEKILEGFPDDGTIQESIESIPVLKSGQFLFISPDNPIPFAMLFTRWLISRHQTLTLDDVRKILEDEIARMKLEEELRRQEEEERKRREEEERRRKEEVERKAREEEERRRKEEVERKAREEEERRRKE
ncbi:MAG: ATP-binding protein, partial [Candidatus Hodarchaeota archaeon]